MRVQDFNDLMIVSLLWCTLMALAPAVLYADVGGGVPSTPYCYGELKEKDIKEARMRAAKWQSICLPAGLAAHEEMHNVSFVYVTVEQLNSAKSGQFNERSLRPLAFHEVRGKAADNAETAVSFSDIESFTVLETTDQKMLLEVVKWPDISTEDLLRIQPTYAQLMAGYRSKARLWVNLTSQTSAQLALYGSYQPPVALATLQPGAQVRFYCNDPDNVHNERLWWAIPSVVSSPDYPYRTIFLE